MVEAPAWIILQRIAAKLAAITVLGGYFTDAGLHVDLDRPKLDADAVVFPRIALGEELTSVTSQALTSAGLAINSSLIVVVEGYIDIDAANAEQLAQRLKCDLARGLGLIRKTDLQDIDGALVNTYEVTGDRPTLRRPDGMSVIAVQAHATIDYITYFPPPA